MRYLKFLSQVHRLLDPEHYLEIGIRNGVSLSLSRCPSVGIDPAYNVTAELDASVRLFRTTSDEYFTRPDPLGPTGGEPFDLAFIDGMHLFEYALRDFINVERSSRPTGVVIFDDVLPRTVDEAARERHTHGWTGDVFWIWDVLARYRPEVTTLLVNTTPTGLLLVTGLDPASTVLAENYARIVDEFRRPDPQPVPKELLERLAVQQPDHVLAAGFWAELTRPHGTYAPAELRDVLRAQFRSDFGEAFAPAR